MDGNSLDIKQEKINKLKELMPEVFTEGDKLDVEKLKLTLGEDINTANERYVLNWAGKSEAFKVLQTPTTATLAPVKDESVNFDTTENIFIEGENLEVLKILQKSYYGKIKMIYIDPPYNTGNDSFIYPDKFSETKAEYLKRIGEKDEDGFLLKEGLYRKNSKENGQYHSNWLNMMYPRLFLAKNLLRDDGVIFISIDDNEVHNLKLIMNEIFGEENFRNSIIRKKGTKSVQRQFETVDRLGSGYETILFYTKNSDYRFKRVEIELDDVKGGSWNNHWRGTDRPTMRYDLFGITPETGQWRWSEIRSKAAVENYELLLSELAKNKDEITIEEIDKWWSKKVEDEELELDLLRLSKLGKPEHYITPSDTKLGNDVWMDIPPNGTSVLKKLFGFKIFDNPKPLELGDRLIRYFTDEDDIVLDFFAGSGTTAQSVLELNKEDNGNRKFILVQLPEITEEQSEAYKAGYKTIADICKERIRRVIKNLTPQSPLQMERGRGSGGNSTENLFKGAVSTLFENAHHLRLVDKTKAEEILWQELRNRKVENCKFRRQHPIGKFIADIYCHEKKLVIEVDGGYHNKEEQKEYDEARTQVINEYGITVIRFTNDEVLNNIQSVLNKIRQSLNITTDENSPLSTWRGVGGEVGFKVFKLKYSNFKLWRGDVIENGDDLSKQIDVFENPVKEGTEEENILYELLLKSGYELTTKIEQKDNIYLVAGGELIVALTKIDDSIIKQIIKLKPQKCIVLDKLFNENDQLKTNTVLQMKDAEIEFKTI